MKIVFLDKDTFQKPDEQFDYSAFKFCEKFITYSNTQSHEIGARAQDADVLIVLKTVLSENILAQLKTTKLICKIGSGYDKIDVKAAKSYGIAVSTFPGHAANIMAQWTISLLLMLAGNIHQYNKSVKSNNWLASQFVYPIYEVNKKTLGIIGYGSIGKCVAKLAVSLGMKVLVHTDYPDGHPGVSFVDKQEIFKNADFISLHSMLNENTKNMIDVNVLNQMKPTSYLINTARAALINKLDLFEALRNKKIAGAAMDVFWSEPPEQDDPMLALDSFIITPHIGWASREVTSPQ